MAINAGEDVGQDNAGGLGKRRPEPQGVSAIRIDARQRVPGDIGIGVDAARQADGVGLDVAAGRGVVVAVSILVQRGLGVVELAP